MREGVGGRGVGGEEVGGGKRWRGGGGGRGVRWITNVHTGQSSQATCQSNVKKKKKKYIYYHYWLVSYSAVLCSQAVSPRSCGMWFWMSDCILFFTALIDIHGSGVWQRGLVVAWLVPRETAAASAHVLYTPYSHKPVYGVTSFKDTSVGCMCVSCNLPPALLAEWPGSFTCYCGNTGVERIPK